LGTGQAEAFDCSHLVRLSGREWLIVAVVLLSLVGLSPVAWRHIERFEPDDDYRVPYELSSDYWLYQRLCERACGQEKVLLVGDSVIWGHYVPPDATLAHHLNALSNEARFANLGLDGTHPAAMEGLLRHYGAALSGRVVVLHLNPLWMSSTRHDLQTTKEFHFNHSELVTQFAVDIPCYKASTSQRLQIVARRAMPFSRWTAHVRAACFDNLGLHAWTLEHPYDCPAAALGKELPKPAAAEPATASSQRRTPARQAMPWVELDSSLQWRFFQRTVRLLRDRHNSVFVLFGPFNEHMLTDENAAAYRAMKSGMERWLRDNGVAFFSPPPLPAEHYVDASHPVGEGYAVLAGMLLEDPSFQAMTAGNVPGSKGQR